MKRKIDEIIIHCSASGPHTTTKDIERWHIARGFFGIGYHFVIENDGSLHTGRNIETMGAHCEGHNPRSIGICLVGGWDTKKLNEFSTEQINTLHSLLDDLQKKIGHPVKIVGHRAYAAKECPNFDVEEFLKTSKIKYLR